MPRVGISLLGLVAMVALVPQSMNAQDWTQREYPLAPPNARGNFVAPYFDGFYQNPDGTYTLSFGFMNRNDEDLIEIPLGPDNFIEPARFDGVQPTSFPTVSYGGFGGPRERGAFSVIVPEDFDGDVWWTLTTDGYTTKVPGRLHGSAELISFESAYAMSTTPQAQGSLRPTLTFDDDVEPAWGLKAATHPQHFRTRVGQPIEVELWAYDRGERELRAVNMTLWKHQGPIGGMVSFESLVRPDGGTAPSIQEQQSSPDLDGVDLPPQFRGRGGRSSRGPGPVGIGETVRLPTEGPDANKGLFRATFDTPGEYLLRVRIDNFTSGDSAMGNACCWSNGYVAVTVTP